MPLIFCTLDIIDQIIVEVKKSPIKAESTTRKLSSTPPPTPITQEEEHLEPVEEPIIEKVVATRKHTEPIDEQQQIIDSTNAFLVSESTPSQDDGK